MPAPKATKPTLPPSHHERINALDLRVVCFLSRAQRCADGSNEWLPCDIVGKDGKSLVVYRTADERYGFAGWEPWHDGMFGGRYTDIHATLAWVERAIGVRAGKYDRF